MIGTSFEFPCLCSRFHSSQRAVESAWLVNYRPHNKAVKRQDLTKSRCVTVSRQLFAADPVVFPVLLFSPSFSAVHFPSALVSRLLRISCEEGERHRQEISAFLPLRCAITRSVVSKQKTWWYMCIVHCSVPTDMEGSRRPKCSRGEEVWFVRGTGSQHVFERVLPGDELCRRRRRRQSEPAGLLASLQRRQSTRQKYL